MVGEDSRNITGTPAIYLHNDAAKDRVYLLTWYNSSVVSCLAIRPRISRQGCVEDGYQYASEFKGKKLNGIVNILAFKRLKLQGLCWNFRNRVSEERFVYCATPKKKSQMFVEFSVCFLRQASTAGFWNTGQKPCVEVKRLMSGRPSWLTSIDIFLIRMFCRSYAYSSGQPNE